MKSDIKERWMTCMYYTDEEVERVLQPWSPSTIKKFLSISTSCPTALKITEQFKGKRDWVPFTTYNPQFPNWEYMVLLKLVYKGVMNVGTTRIRGRETLVFKTASKASRKARKEKPMCVCCDNDRDCCGATHMAYVCTREKGHRGRHMACSFTIHKMAVWR